MCVLMTALIIVTCVSLFFNKVIKALHLMYSWSTYCFRNLYSNSKYWAMYDYYACIAAQHITIKSKIKLVYWGELFEKLTTPFFKFNFLSSVRPDHSSKVEFVWSSKASCWYITQLNRPSLLFVSFLLIGCLISFF